MVKPSRNPTLPDHADEYRSLIAQHRDFETRLAELTRKPILSGTEKVEITNIKKFKLRIKDRLVELVQLVQPVQLRPAVRPVHPPGDDAGER